MHSFTCKLVRKQNQRNKAFTLIICERKTNNERANKLVKSRPGLFIKEEPRIGRLNKLDNEGCASDTHTPTTLPQSSTNAPTPCEKKGKIEKPVKYREIVQN